MKQQAFPILRVSTKSQVEDGHGLESQLAEVSRWLSNHPDLELGESLKLEGVSAYKKQHVTAILEFVATLPKGSTVILTEPSRLVRTDFKSSFEFLWKINELGIHVAFTNIGIYIKAGSTKQDEAYTQLSMWFNMARQESENKAFRINNAFTERHTRIMNGTHIKKTGLPAWVTLNDDKSGYLVSDVNRETLDRIIHLKLNGMGVYSIVATLNQENRPLFPRLKTWANSNINSILRNIALYGAYQAFTNKDGKRVPRCEPVENYYPSIISKDVFLQVQNSFKKTTRGKGKPSNNLFRGLLRCSECGGGLSLNQTSRTTYVRCERKKNTLQCTQKSIRYSAVYERVTHLLSFLDLGILNHDKRDSGSIQLQIDTIENQIQASTLMAGGLTDPQQVQQQITRINTLTSERDALTAELIQLTTSNKTDIQSVNPDSPLEYNAALKSILHAIIPTQRGIGFHFKARSVTLTIRDVALYENTLEELQTQFEYHVDDSILENLNEVIL